MTGRAYGLDVTALRFFNVYGPRQSLSNPYTGIFTAFLSRLAQGKAPEVYEDGLMTRYLSMWATWCRRSSWRCAPPEVARITLAPGRRR